MKSQKITLEPIGIIHSPFKTTNTAPPQGDDTPIKMEIYQKYEQGLTDIEGFSHIHVLYWLHESKNYSLMVKTPWDVTPHGLFSTRSPNRPNPIGYSVVKIISKQKNILNITNLDAIDKTPIIDIKPYIARRDAKPKATEGWLSHTQLR